MGRKIIRISFVLLILIFAFCKNLPAGKLTCPDANMLKLIGKVKWDCLLPASIEGTCFCMRLISGVPVPVPGIMVSFWDPAYLIEVVRKEYCFPSFAGTTFVNTLIGKNGIRSGSDGTCAKGSKNSRSSFHIHFMRYPLLLLLGLLEDATCLDVSAGNYIDSLYISEVDPTWNNNQLSVFLNPENLLFGNPLAQLACIPDSIASTLGHPIDILFWCAGAWGNVYPLSNEIPEADNVVAAAFAAFKIFAKMTRIGLLKYWDFTGCFRVQKAIWKKSNFKLQLLYPFASGCINIGKPGLLWSFFKQLPIIGKSGAYVFLGWKFRRCCAL